MCLPLERLPRAFLRVWTSAAVPGAALQMRRAMRSARCMRSSGRRSVDTSDVAEGRSSSAASSTFAILASAWTDGFVSLSADAAAGSMESERCGTVAFDQRMEPVAGVAAGRRGRCFAQLHGSPHRLSDQSERGELQRLGAQPRDGLILVRAKDEVLELVGAVFLQLCKRRAASRGLLLMYRYERCGVVHYAHRGARYTCVRGTATLLYVIVRIKLPH